VDNDDSLPKTPTPGMGFHFPGDRRILTSDSPVSRETDGWILTHVRFSGGYKARFTPGVRVQGLGFRVLAFISNLGPKQQAKKMLKVHLKLFQPFLLVYSGP